MRRTGALTLVASLAIAFVACGEVPVKPERPTVDMVGPLAGIQEGNKRITYTLEDGRQWVRARDEYEVVYDLPSGPTLFVALSNPAGTFVLLVGGQDGLPADCSYALRYGGREWGDSIESQGFLWPKADGFVPLPGGPASGGAYATNAGFCLDEQAAVTSVYIVTPNEDNTAPAPSVRG